MSSSALLGCGPGGELVVAGSVAQAAVQDADPSVGQGAEGLLMGGPAGTVTVIAGASTG